MKEIGYFFSNVEVVLTELDDNKVELKYLVDLGEKAKIRKINFVGNKIFKDRKLKELLPVRSINFGNLFLKKNT